MLHVMHSLAAMQAAEGQLAAYGRCLQIQRTQIESSRRWPNRVLGMALGVLYAAALLLAAAYVRVVHRTRPEPLVRRLAEAYPGVPEMVVHKAIELKSLRHRRLEGRGLDLGCGDGIVGGILIREAGLTELHGIDVSAIDEATVHRRGYAGYLVADMQSLPYAEASFDYVVCICVIEHVPDLDGVLEEARRVLRPGGRLCFTTPSPAYREAQLVYRVLRGLGLRRKAELFKDFRDVMAKHHHYLTENEWVSRLRSLGYEEISVDPILTRAQLAIYDLMNIWVYALPFCFYEHLARWAAQSATVRRMLVFAAAEIGSAASREIADGRNATHFSIACRRLGARAIVAPRASAPLSRTTRGLE
jgi:ubiquinone/menaquinone biosynthesis C-methylase UbiE